MPFVKGHKINVGRKQSAEERKKHRYTMLGERNHRFGKSPWNKNKKCNQLSSENNGCWKGDSASYAAKHIWMKVNFGIANKCENIQCPGISKNYHWANISGKYKRVRSDWKMLCVSCHKKYDRRSNGRN